MKKSLVAALFATLAVCLSFQAGCWFQHDGNPAGPGSGLPTTVPTGVGETATVRFRIVLPDTQTPFAGILSADNGAFPTILAAASATPTVTFTLILVNIGVATNPTTTLSRTVPVDASGTASCTFTAVPAQTCIGDITINGGRIGSYSAFHGAADLLASVENVVLLSPKNSGTLEDLLARIIDGLTRDSEAFLVAPSRLAGWASLALSSFQGTDFGSAFAIVRAALLAGSPFQASTSQVTIQLPAGSTLATAGLKLVTALGEQPVSESGIVSREAVIATEGIAVCMVANSSGKPVFYSLTSTQASTGVVNASTTAEALVLCDPFFQGASAEKMAQARQFVAGHSRFGELVSEIEASIRNNPEAPLDPDLRPNLVQISAAITADLLAQDFPTPPPSIRAAGQVTDAVYVLDDPAHSTDEVLLYNKTAASYRVSVWRGDQRVSPPDTLLESFPLSHKTMMESLIGGEAIHMAVSAGSGKLRFVFERDDDFTLAEAVIKCCSKVLGLPAFKDKMVFNLLSTSVAKTFLKTIVDLYKTNSNDMKAFSLGLLSVLGKGETGKAFLALVFQEFDQAGWQGGWAIFENILAFVAKKIPIVAAVQPGYPGVEFGWVIFNGLQAPPSYEEGGVQFNGKYPFELAAPGNPRTEAGSKQVTVRWDAVEGATGYDVYWGTQAGIATPTAPKVSVTGTSHLFTDLTNEVTYYYVLVALDADGNESAASAEVSAKPTAARFTKDADGVITDSQTGLQWYDGYNGTTTYTWYQADAWATGLAVGGGGWTIATRDQLKGLRGDGWNSGLFTSYWSWSSELGPTQTEPYLGDSSTAWTVGILNDGEDWFYRSYRHLNVLAVRSRR